MVFSSRCGESDAERGQVVDTQSLPVESIYEIGIMDMLVVFNELFFVY